MNWPTVALRDVSRTDGQYGVGLSAREWKVGDPRYVRITDIDGDGRLGSNKVAPQGDRPDWEKAQLQRGDLLFARSGATVGKTYLHTACDQPAVFAGYLIRFQLDPDRMLPEYAFRYTQSPQYRAWVANSQRTVAQPNINAKQYASLPIPSPPLDEQRRIAAILDQADALRAKNRGLIASLGSLPLSVFLDMFGDPDMATTWGQVKRLGDIADLQGGKNIVAEDTNTPSKYRVLKISAVTSGEFKETETKPLPLGYQPPVDHIVRQGDLLISRANTTELVGAVAYVRDAPPNLALPDKIWRFVWRDPESVPLYYWSLFRTDSVRQSVSRLSSGTGGSMKNISKAKLFELEIPDISTSRQREFARRLAAIPRATPSCFDELFTSLQSRAFSGQL